MDQLTELCRIAFKYGTDKCPQIRHTYTPFYYELLKGRRKSIKKVLEIGIGYYGGIEKTKKIYDPGLKRYYHRGASLYMWRNFFPNARIYGADIHPESLFEDKRIKTYLCDEKNKDNLTELIKNTGSNIDLVVDDGSHKVDHQMFACQILMPILKKDVIYVIEDARRSRIIVKTFAKKYDCWVPKISNQGGVNQLVVIKNRVK